MEIVVTRHVQLVDRDCDEAHRAGRRDGYGSQRYELSGGERLRGDATGRAWAIGGQVNTAVVLESNLDTNQIGLRQRGAGSQRTRCCPDRVVPIGGRDDLGADDDGHKNE